ncbi:10488_t:CDS:10 [Paraglomus occultum]|uniref:Terpene cyclase/mutase family member n=1 Tax=Paraglomus occultum TaxID=144539 RepID=A0A9N9GC87_9GLOM|nr:10488_t:CDS:10 [Paraglomus occultum]
MKYSNPLGETDPKRWRLRVDHGRQTWHYLKSDKESEEWLQTKADMYWLGMEVPSTTFPPAKTALDAARNGFEFYKQLQTEDGHWAGENSGPMFVLPGLVISMYITKLPVPEEWKIEIVKYLFNCAHPEDGGWGFHVEGDSTVFGTALNYVVLRLLGIDADHPVLAKARATLHKLGGATGIASWGKLWLAVLNCYDWDGLNPIMPELWLLPYWLPFHPGRFWVHTRNVYLPMGYIYGRRLSADVDPLIKSLRQELYTQPYESIHWSSQASNIAQADSYVSHTRVLKILNFVLRVYENLPNLIGLRDMAIKESYKLIELEDKNSSYLDVGPVPKAMNLLCTYFEEGPESQAFQESKERLIDYIWVSKKGMMMNGTADGAQLWDTAFIVQAMVESGLAKEPQNHESMIRALEFIDDCQIKCNASEMERCYRHCSKGAWPFSTRDQGYNVSDCTAEGLKSVIDLQNELSYTKELVSKDRLYDAVDVLLTMQNADGGFATYELIRGPKILEWINPTELFGGIMIEYSYSECTASVLTALLIFRKHYPDYRADEIISVCEKAADFIKKSQEESGGWCGTWAVCYTYAGMLALESLANFGEFYDNSEFSQKGCDFLISLQKPDGGWGESYKSCELNKFIEHPESQVVNTAMALLALMSARYPHEEPIRRGIKLIMSRQQANGEWRQEAIEGAFNKNCIVTYPNYKFIFTIWALGRYAKMYNNPELL